MDTQERGIAINGIGLAVPPYRLEQRETAARLAQALAERPDEARWARRVFRQNGVETRYTCEPNLLAAPEACRYFPAAGQKGLQAPSTAERMAIYKRQSVPLAEEAALAALADASIEPERVTHLITVSCTGQFLPGLDAELVWRLGLAADVQRLPLQFLGCAAGLKAIGHARQWVAADPRAVVLIACVELCTLHIQPSGDREALYGASFFGDGASACIVSTASERDRFLLGEPYSILLPDSAEQMRWGLGDNGFDLYLSPEVPRLIARHIPAELERMADGKMPDWWAVHPGGKGIVDAVQTTFDLSEEQVAASRSVLRRYGNLSSATILYVLEELRRTLDPSRDASPKGLAVAFGPGLTFEGMRMSYASGSRAASRDPDKAGVGYA